MRVPTARRVPVPHDRSFLSVPSRRGQSVASTIEQDALASPFASRRSPSSVRGTSRGTSCRLSPSLNLRSLSERLMHLAVLLCLVARPTALIPEHESVRRTTPSRRSADSSPIVAPAGAPSGTRRYYRRWHADPWHCDGSAVQAWCHGVFKIAIDGRCACLLFGWRAVCVRSDEAAHLRSGGRLARRLRRALGSLVGTRR